MVTIHGTSVQALLDSGTVPSVLFSKLECHLGIGTKVFAKKIGVGNGDAADKLGAALNLNIPFEGIPASLDFLVIDTLPFGVIIGPPVLESLQARIDLETQTVTITQGKEKIKIALVYDP